jgi:hypothetical protein
VHVNLRDSDGGDFHGHAQADVAALVTSKPAVAVDPARGPIGRSPLLLDRAVRRELPS